MKNHYSDPTANTAIGNVERERRRAEKQNASAPRKEAATAKHPRRKAAPAAALTYRYVRFDANGQMISSSIITPSGSTPEAFLLQTS